MPLEFANYSLIFVGLFIILFIFYNYFYKILSKCEDLLFILNIMNSIGLILIMVVFLFIYGYLNSHMSLINILKYSNVLESIFYKSTAFWGNQDGSMILWSLVLVIYGLLFMNHFSFNKFYFFLKTLNYHYYNIFFFLFYIIIFCNPFLKHYEFKVECGQLNPILQDPTLAIHPPFLYMGYLGASLLFSLAIFILLNKSWSYYYLSIIKYFIIFTWITLTIGIALGSWWAYYELGWGGWWFWDPVENISLIPWFLNTALLHHLVLNNKFNLSNNWTLYILIFLYLFVLWGTYIVRSGLLSSLHSFVQDSMGSNILFLYLISLSIFVLLKLLNLKNNLFIHFKLNLFSKENFMKINTSFFIIMSIIIFLSILLPILFKLIYNLDMIIDTNFFNKIFGSMLYPIILLMIITPLITWQKFNMLIPYKYFTLSFIIIIFLNLYINNYFSSIFTFSLFLLIILLILNLLNLFLLTNKINSMIIGHMAIALLLLTIFINNEFKTSIVYYLYPGDKLIFQDYIIYFRNLHYFLLKNYYSVYYDLFIEGNYHSLFTTFIEHRDYILKEPISFKPNVHTNLISDLYFILGNGDFHHGWYVKIIVNPLMINIWLSALLFLYAARKMTKNLKKLNYYY